MTNVVGFYDNPSQAQKAVNELIEAGIWDLDLMGGQAARDRNLDDQLCGFGIDRHSAHAYAGVVRQGKVLINARPALEQADEAMLILERNGAREFEAVAGEARQAEQQQAVAEQAQTQEGEPAAQEQRTEGGEAEQQPSPQQAQGEEGQQAEASSPTSEQSPEA